MSAVLWVLSVAWRKMSEENCGLLQYLMNYVHQEYQRVFHKTKVQLEQTPSERQFDFSEMYIFGKFDTFQRRLKKILEMLNTISIYSALQDPKIEGLETMATRFQVGTFFKAFSVLCYAIRYHCCWTENLYVHN